MFLSISLIGQEHNFINYSVRQGLPQSQVNDLVQDEKGFLWIATQGGGVSKFDGLGFEVINTSNDLPSNFAKKLFIDDQDIWIGTQSGLCRLRSGKVDLIRNSDFEIQDIILLNDSLLLLGTNSGLQLFNKSRESFEYQMLDDHLEGSDIHQIVQVEKEIYIATSSGLYKMETFKIERIPISASSLDIRSLVLHGNKLWLGIYGHGLLIWDKVTKKERHVRKFDQHSLESVSELSVIKDEIWVGTSDEGLFRCHLDLDTWSRVSEENGLVNNNVQCIFEDISNNIWIGSVGGGLNKYVGQNFDHFTIEDGLIGNRIYAVYEDSRRNLWMSCDNKGVSLRDTLNRIIDIDKDRISARCTDIFEDRKGAMWMSTDGQGIFKLDTSGYTLFNTSTGFPSDRILNVQEDRANSIWVATRDQGLVKIVNDKSGGVRYILYGENQGLDDVELTYMTQGVNQNIWFATRNGSLGFVEKNYVTMLGDSNGLPRVTINSLAFDDLNRVWFGTSGQGIFKGTLENGRYIFEQIEENFSLSSQNINLLLFDNEGNLWSGSEVGLDKLILNESGFIINIIHYGLNEGFTGIETCKNAAALDDQGDLWFGTLNGLSRHQLGSVVQSSSKPSIYLEHMMVNNQQLTSSSFPEYFSKHNVLLEHLNLSFEMKDVGFSFRSVDINRPVNIMYSWRLNGQDSSWSKWSSSTSANYSNLKAGSYSFELKAINKSGIESDLLIESFVIDQAFWHSWLFRLSALSGIAFLFYLLNRRRITKVRKEESQKREKLEIENEILDLEQKALQLQMNPHFIFNALNSVQSLMIDERTEDARKQMQNFASLMRGILNNSKQTSISLEEEVDTLKRYLDMEQYCQAQSFNYDIALPTEYSAEEIELPPMMIQPFVENAIIHGLAPLKSVGKIDIAFEIKGQLLTCSIKDNGVGLVKSQELKLKSSKKHESSAIEITKKRLKALRGNRRYEYFYIKDIVSNEGVIEGTEVFMTMPLEVNF